MSKSDIAEIVKRVEEARPDLAVEMRELLSKSILDLEDDPQLNELLLASIEGNLSTIFHMLLNDIGLEKIQPPTAALEYAVRLAQRDIPISALTRAYYLAQGLFLSASLEEVAGLNLPEGAKIATVKALANIVNSYIDKMLQNVAEVHETERKRWWSARATANTSTILKVLRGENVATQEFYRQTAYSLEQKHLAMVLWLGEESGVQAQQKLDRLVRQIATTLGSTHAPLASAADPTTMWAWVSMVTDEISVTTRDNIDRMVAAEGGIRLALGSVATGPDGFIVSHESAIRARQVALSVKKYAQYAVISDADPGVALTAILLKDHLAALDWINRILGRYTEPGTANEQMRQTLKVYYESGQNVSQTATSLGVHRNTVSRRINTFEAETTARVIDPLEVALALKMYEMLEEAK